MKIEIDLSEYIHLLNVELYSKKQAKGIDSSWNYGIEELEEKINHLQSKYNEGINL